MSKHERITITVRAKDARLLAMLLQLYAVYAATKIDASRVAGMNDNESSDDAKRRVYAMLTWCRSRRKALSFAYQFQVAAIDSLNQSVVHKLI